MIFLVKANLALCFFWIVYRFLLRGLTFYRLNRAYLLGAIGICAVLPLLPATLLVPPVPSWTHWVVSGSGSPQSGWFDLVRGIWLAGVAVMGGRLLIQLASWWKLHRRSREEKVESFRIRIPEGDVPAFSFFKLIYLQPGKYLLPDLKLILSHESLHGSGWHTLDILLAEIELVFYWFNPGAWLIRSAIGDNLEFLVDREMISNGVDPETYQYGLLRETQSKSLPFLARTFSQSNLKNRLSMINRNRSSRLQVLRYLVILPLAGASLALLGNSRPTAGPGTQDPAVHRTISFAPDSIPATRNQRVSPKIRASAAPKASTVTVRASTAPRASMVTVRASTAPKASTLPATPPPAVAGPVPPPPPPKRPPPPPPPPPPQPPVRGSK